MHWFVSKAALDAANLEEHFYAEARRLMRKSREEEDALGGVCALASEILQERLDLPSWIAGDTRFLIIRDVSTPACMRLPTLLRLHKPDQRLFLTDDRLSVRRWVIAPLRDKRFEGIIDAYIFDGLLTVFMGDLSIRQFPVDRIRALKDVGEELDQYTLDEDGSFIAWRKSDVHLSPAQLLQAVDPSELADAEIERFRRENTAVAIQKMREQRGLRQSDIASLSERQVSRLENGRSRLTADSASKFAKAFGLSMKEFFDEIGELLLEWEEADRHDGQKESAAAVL